MNPPLAITIEIPEHESVEIQCMAALEKVMTHFYQSQMDGTEHPMDIMRIAEWLQLRTAKCYSPQIIRQRKKDESH